MKSIIVAAGIALAGLLGAQASQTPASVAPPEQWTLDPVHSAALFRIHHAGAGRFWGRFNDVSGTVDWNRDDSAAPEFAVAVAAESIDTGNTKLDGHLKAPDFFNAREFESITFNSTGGERLGERRWRITGDMTLLGVTKPIEAEVEVTGVVGSPVMAKAGWEAKFEIDRSAFGMDWGIDRGALSDDVQLIVALEGGIEPGR
ncbi:MAG: YceI family protein [Phycisphaerales bacterium]|jgi:polyisoprenoid-binding protein YceI|nr:YceI family protein [Phycisphaerales bacterium]